MSDLKRTVRLKHRASLKTFLCNKQISSDYFIRSDLGMKLLATYKLRHVHAQQGSLRYVSEFSRLSRNSPYRRPLIHLVRVAGFIEEQVATEACEAALMQLESLSSGGSPQKAPNPNKSNNTNATEKMEAGEAKFVQLQLIMHLLDLFQKNKKANV